MVRSWFSASVLKKTSKNLKKYLIPGNVQILMVFWWFLSTVNSDFLSDCVVMIVVWMGFFWVPTSYTLEKLEFYFIMGFKIFSVNASKSFKSSPLSVQNFFVSSYQSFVLEFPWRLSFRSIRSLVFLLPDFSAESLGQVDRLWPVPYWLHPVHLLALWMNTGTRGKSSRIIFFLKSSLLRSLSNNCEQLLWRRCGKYSGSESMLMSYSFTKALLVLFSVFKTVLSPRFLPHTLQIAWLPTGCGPCHTGCILCTC